VVCEVALSLVLLTGAGLLARTFLRITDKRLGFDPHHVLTAQVQRQMTNGFSTPSQVPFFDELLTRIRTLPGAEAWGPRHTCPEACVVRTALDCGG
jgi:putative ABC transport system permease protein